MAATRRNARELAAAIKLRRAIQRAQIAGRALAKARHDKRAAEQEWVDAIVDAEINPVVVRRHIR